LGQWLSQAGGESSDFAAKEIHNPAFRIRIYMLYVNIIMALYCVFVPRLKSRRGDTISKRPARVQGQVSGDSTENSEEPETSMEHVDW
jgi:hypothetical protein